MKIFCSVIGRKWDHQVPHVTQANLAAFARELARNGHEIVWWNYTDPFPTEYGAFLIQPGFNLPGGKYMISTRLVMEMCKADRRPLILFTGDVENLITWSGYVLENKIRHGLVTSFRFPWKCWKAPWLYHDRSVYYDNERIMLNVGKDQPAFQLGYVGWPKPARFKVLKAIGYLPMVMLGFGADKQDVFPAAYCDKNTPYPFLGELFKACAWQMCASDPQINQVGPCVSRHFESWRFGRPSSSRMRSTILSACFISSIDSLYSCSASSLMPQFFSILACRKYWLMAVSSL